MSDIATGGTASASESYAGFSASNAFDKDDATCWGNNARLPVQLQYELLKPSASVGYTVMCSDTDPSWNDLVYTPLDFLLEGSQDGTNWTTLDTQTGQTWVAGVPNVYTYLQSLAYKFYRINITAGTSGGSNYVGIYELTIIGSLLTKKPTSLVLGLPVPCRSGVLLPTSTELLTGDFNRGY